MRTSRHHLRPQAQELVYEKQFRELLGQVDNETTILMGHTRWRTRGNEFNNRNNHPIRAGIVIGTHNGTIYNADYLFRRLGLPRYAEVDSELIFRLADRFAPEGPIDRLEGFRPGGRSMYQRVMVAVLCGRNSIPAWTYWMPRIDTGIRLGSGVWHRPC